MALTGITFFLMVGASAHEVPHWVKQDNARLNVPNFDKLMAPMLSLKSKMQAAQQSPNSRRLQKIMSDECKAACPGVEAYLDMIMGKTPTKAPAEGVDAGTAAMLAMCDHQAAMTCSGTNEACMDETEEKEEEDDKDAADSFACMCACPKLALAADPKKMCPDVSAIVGCMGGESKCTTMMKQMGGKEMADLTCKMHDADCEGKGSKLATCVGMEKMGTFGGDCSTAANDLKLADHKDKCCPLLKDVMGCYSTDCVKWGWKVQVIQAKELKGDEKTEADKAIAGNFQWGEVCTDSGLPKSEAELNPPPPAAADGSVGTAMSLLTIVSAMAALIA